MDQGLPSDILMGKRHPLFGGWKPSRDQLLGSIVALVFVAGMTIGLVALNSFVLAPTSDPTGTATVTDLGVYTPSASGSIVHVTTVAAPASGRDELTVTYVPPPTHQNGGKCPYGTTANAVDANGYESNCQSNGPGNKPCVAYDDQNHCTAYLQD